MDITKIKNDKNLFEKILLALWFSIPCDNTVLPDKIEITKDHGDFINVNLIKENTKFGVATIQKFEIDRYLDKLKDLKEHELDIINRLEKEVIEKKKCLLEKKPKKR